MQTVPLQDNLHEMSDPIFRENKKKCHELHKWWIEFAHGALGVKSWQYNTFLLTCSKTNSFFEKK